MKNAISPAQSRAARGLLNWSRDKLAEVGGVPARTVADFELGNTVPRASTTAKLVTALEAAGVIFVDENGEGPGVRLKKSFRDN